MTLQEVKVKARYGHRDWIYWRDRDGLEFAKKLNSAAVKEAMLATGTKGCRFLVHANCGTLTKVHWRLAVSLLARQSYA